MFGQSYTKTLERAVVIGQKLIHDLVPQLEIVADHENEHGVIGPSRPHSPAEEPCVKKIHDRLNAEGSVP